MNEYKIYEFCIRNGICVSLGFERMPKECVKLVKGALKRLVSHEAQVFVDVREAMCFDETQPASLLPFSDMLSYWRSPYDLDLFFIQSKRFRIRVGRIVEPNEKWWLPAAERSEWERPLQERYVITWARLR